MKMYNPSHPVNEDRLIKLIYIVNNRKVKLVNIVQ